MQITLIRKPQVCVLGSAEPGSAAYELSGEASALLAHHGITVISGCGSPENASSCGARHRGRRFGYQHHSTG